MIATPDGSTQIDVYPGADNNLLGSAAATPAFWNYYAVWATAYAAYYGYGLSIEIPGNVYNPDSVERLITVPAEWQAWLATLDRAGAKFTPGAVASAAAGPPAPPPPPPGTVTTITSPSGHLTVMRALGAMWQDITGAWAWLTSKL